MILKLCLRPLAFELQEASAPSIGWEIDQCHVKANVL